MKILHLSSEYPPAKVYGLGRFVHGLARAQAAVGHEVHVLTNSCGGSEDDLVLDGVHLHRIGFPNPPRPPSGQGEVFQFNHGVLARALERRSRFDDLDVIATHDWLTAIAGRELARLLGVPLVVTFHDEVVGKHFGSLNADAQFVRELERLTAHDASHVVANSEFIAERVCSQYGVPAERVSAIPGGIDPRVLAVRAPEQPGAFRSVLAEADEVLVTYVGRFDSEKGLEVLVEAALEAAEEVPQLRFVFAGSGALGGFLEQSLAPLGARAQVLGYVSGETLGYLYRASDMVVVPSFYEPFGLVALEAMLAQATVIASETGGLREIVRHEKDGLLVSPGSSQDLRQAIVRLAGRPGLRKRLARAGRARAAGEFSWDEISKRTCAAYQCAIEAPRAVCEVAPEAVAVPEVTVVVEASSSAAEWFHELCARTEGRLRLLEVSPSRPLEESLGDGEEPVLLASERLRVPSGSEGWLSGLLWLQEVLEAETASPTFGARGAGLVCGGDPVLDCVLATRAALVGAGEFSLEDYRDGRARLGAAAGGHWTHSTPLALAGPPGGASSIVMVAYNGSAYTRAAIEAVLRGTEAPFDLILVDNGSSDGTADLLDGYAQSPPEGVRIRVLRNAENLGYPVAANQGVAASRGGNVVLLNNDTEVRPGWLAALESAAEGCPSAGIVTPKILNFDGSVQNAGGVLHHPDGSFTIPHAGEDRLAPPAATPAVLDNAGGPCMLLTRGMLEAVGCFDEGFSPGYFEDSDLCLRARAAGFTLHYAPRAEVQHHAKVTSSQVAREGKLDVWGRFEVNKRKFYERWGAELVADETRRRAQAEPLERQRIVLCYGKSETTTAAYCEAALREAHEVVTAGPGQELDLGRVSARELLEEAGGADLLLVIEGENYLPVELQGASAMTAWWAIDNHLHARPGGWHLRLAREFDSVFVAQRDYLSAFTGVGARAAWLPLGCAPAVHRRVPDLEEDYEVLFVGNVRSFHRRRRRLLDRLAKTFQVTELQGVFREDMARAYSRAKVVFNCSLAGDMNMRVFEGLCSGSLLVTDRVLNGQEDLFASGEHLLTYDDEDLVEVVAAALADDARRREIGARGAELVTRHHTYTHRMEALLRAVATLQPAGANS